MYVSCLYEIEITGAPPTVGGIDGCVLTMTSVRCLPPGIYEYLTFIGPCIIVILEE